MLGLLLAEYLPAGDDLAVHHQCRRGHDAHGGDPDKIRHVLHHRLLPQLRQGCLYGVLQGAALGAAGAQHLNVRCLAALRGGGLLLLFPEKTHVCSSFD